MAFAAQPVVYEEDAFGNLETADNSTVVTATLESGTGPLLGTNTVIVSGGVATFANLADSKAETISLDFRGAGLVAGPTSDIVVSPASQSAGGSGGMSTMSTSHTTVTAAAPTIRLEQIVKAQKTGKKGKPVGKPVLIGFALDYSTAMNPSTAGLAADYQVDTGGYKASRE